MPTPRRCSATGRFVGYLSVRTAVPAEELAQAEQVYARMREEAAQAVVGALRLFRLRAGDPGIAKVDAVAMRKKQRAPAARFSQAEKVASF